jgi:aspartate/methionine/tyrosine aminotransferase
MTKPLPALSLRNDAIAPFQTMELVKSAQALEASGRSIIHMSIGEPDFTATPSVIEALNQALAQGKSHYTPALGIAPLREAIATHYLRTEALEVDPACVIVTAGASAALTLACLALVNPGDEVLLTDPSYPCNRHFVAAANGIAKTIPVGPETRYQLNAELIRKHWSPSTRGVLLASPANPTGTSMAWVDVVDSMAEVRSRDGFVIMDEIYQGLCYGDALAGIAPNPRSALHARKDVVICNSFSKTFHMTGWRLGWLVVPPDWVASFEKLQQNLFICPSALAQYAALGCFTEESLAIIQERKREFERRRDCIIAGLRRLGFEIPLTPDGAFYVWANIKRFGMGSSSFTQRMLQEAGVSIVPGADFGLSQANDWVRFSYACPMDHIEAALTRIEHWLGTL